MKIKMKTKILSTLIIGGIFSTINVAMAQEEVENVDTKEVDRILEITNRNNLSSSLQKSQYRNEVSELALQEQLLARQIAVRNRLLDLRKLDYMLDMPIEAHIDESNFNLKPDEDEERRKIEDNSFDLKQYEPSTYEADQIIFQEKEKQEGEATEKESNEPSPPERMPSVRESNPSEVQRGVSDNRRPSVPQVSVPTPQPVRNQNNAPSESVEGELTEDELAVLGITREEYQKWIVSDEDTETNLNPDIAEIDNLGSTVETDQESEDVVEIRDVKVNKIVIFGEKRRADIEINYYMGDGVTGDTELVSYRNLRQGDVINYNGYRMLVNRITRTDVEILNEETNKRKIGTSTYR